MSTEPRLGTSEIYFQTLWLATEVLDGLKLSSDAVIVFLWQIWVAISITCVTLCHSQILIRLGYFNTVNSRL